jgi:hypothetical protein
LRYIAQNTGNPGIKEISKQNQVKKEGVLFKKEYVVIKDIIWVAILINNK